MYLYHFAEIIVWQHANWTANEGYRSNVEKYHFANFIIEQLTELEIGMKQLHDSSLKFGHDAAA